MIKFYAISLSFIIHQRSSKYYVICNDHICKIFYFKFFRIYLKIYCQSYQNNHCQMISSLRQNLLLNFL
jgi:hypothetical protein